jgi:hypothetical protein
MKNNRRSIRTTNLFIIPEASSSMRRFGKSRTTLALKISTRKLSSIFTIWTEMEYGTLMRLRLYSRKN